MKRWKLVAAVVAGLLAIILVLQNTQEVETRLLFVTVTMPRAVLLLVTLLIGFILGLLLAGRLKGKTTAPDR